MVILKSHWIGPDGRCSGWSGVMSMIIKMHSGQNHADSGQGTSFEARALGAIRALTMCVCVCV